MLCINSIKIWRNEVVEDYINKNIKLELIFIEPIIIYL